VEERKRRGQDKRKGGLEEERRVGKNYASRKDG